jgi:hypothetical protein
VEGFAADQEAQVETGVVGFEAASEDEAFASCRRAGPEDAELRTRLTPVVCNHQHLV